MAAYNPVAAYNPMAASCRLPVLQLWRIPTLQTKQQRWPTKRLKPCLSPSHQGHELTRGPSCTVSVGAFKTVRTKARPA
jgi:hypothetical protein